jgi:hypothetical protein
MVNSLFETVAIITTGLGKFQTGNALFNIFFGHASLVSREPQGFGLAAKAHTAA